MRSKRARLRSQADELWYKKYLKPACEICGKKYVLQGHHFFYKSQYGHLRYDPENHITLCHRCHFLLHHKDPKLLTDHIIKLRGNEWYEALKNKAQQNPRSYLNVKYYEDIIKQLKVATLKK